MLKPTKFQIYKINKMYVLWFIGNEIIGDKKYVVLRALSKFSTSKSNK